MEPLPSGPLTEEKVIDVLKSIYDPEIPVNIYDLGLIYETRIDPDVPRVYVKMTLTSPGCPVAGTFPGMIEMRLRENLGVNDIEVELTFDPPFTLDRLSDEARLQLGLL
jgi:FeS assembly SUF system protein